MAPALPHLGVCDEARISLPLFASPLEITSFYFLTRSRIAEPALVQNVGISVCVCEGREKSRKGAFEDSSFLKMWNT